MFVVQAGFKNRDIAAFRCLFDYFEVKEFLLYCFSCVGGDLAFLIQEILLACPILKLIKNLLK